MYTCSDRRTAHEEVDDSTRGVTRRRVFGVLSRCDIRRDGSQPPIVIASDSDFQKCNCVSGGSGTTTNPYIIGPWKINSLAPDGVGVSVDGTLLTKSFTLFKLTLAGNGAALSKSFWAKHDFCGGNGSAPNRWPRSRILGGES